MSANPSTPTDPIENSPMITGQTFTIEILDVPDEVVEGAKRRRERFLERHPESDADLEDFLVEHLDWEWLPEEELPNYWDWVDELGLPEE